MKCQDCAERVPIRRRAATMAADLARAMVAGLTVVLLIVWIAYGPL